MSRKTRKMPKVIRWFNMQYSLDVADAINPEQILCWRNAVRALRTPALNLSTAKYVEGVFVTPITEEFGRGGNYVIPHGWLELEDGTIVDPTFAYYPDDSKCDFYEEEVEAKYQPLQYYILSDLDGISIEELPVRKMDVLHDKAFERYW